MDKQKAILDEKVWTEESIMESEIEVLETMIACRTAEAVEAAICYARFLHLSTISEDNYPLYLKLLEVENHWVIDSLMGKKNPFLLMNSIHPNNYLILTSFKLLTTWHPGGIYPKTLSIVLGALQSAYSSAKDGMKIYQASINDINNLGKHMNKELGQDDTNNRCILNILDRFGSLEGTDDNPDVEMMARQANAIRTFFFDKKKKMEDVIPQVLLVKSDYITKEMSPKKIFLN